MSQKIPPFNLFRQAANKQKKVIPYAGKILTLDPGETTGYSIWNSDPLNATMIKCGQLKTWPMQEAVKSFTDILQAEQPDLVVFERYNIYEWKTDSHSWSDVPTLRIIGCLETLCIQLSINIYNQSAQQAKNFCDDEKLQAWNLWIKGQRHARDAIRHGVFFLMFGPINDS